LGYTRARVSAILGRQQSVVADLTRACALRTRRGNLAIEIVDIRQYDASDFAALLAAESEAWRASLHWDYAGSARLIATCLNERRLTGYALVDQRRITGYSFFLYEAEKGLIGGLYVERDTETHGRALLLLEHVLETLMATPGIRRIEAQLPHFSAQELEPAFAPRHFKSYLRNFMLLPLAPPRAHQGASLPARTGNSLRAGQPADAFSVEPWERRYERQAVSMLYHTYRDHIDAVINDQYSSTAGAARLVENIVQLRGCGEFITRASSVAIHRSTRKLAGVLALTAVRPATAHIPQIAVAPEFQGVGLGSLMLKSAFEELQREGFHEVSLTVTDMNQGAVRLYERLGFETFHSFGAFVWNQHST
jgi:ribosomal protein S18 acetylase RimI-like enzyme